MHVYVIRNSATGKVYIGQHKGNSLKKYLQTKLSDASKHRGQSRLYNSMRKHPRDVWSIEPLMEADTKEELDRMETLLIALYDTRNPAVGYNICKGGEGRTSPLSPEERVKLWANNKAYWNSRGLVGKTFNQLYVESEVPIRSNTGKKLWNCRCTCGNHSQVETSALKSGNIRSCGCSHTSEMATKAGCIGGRVNAVSGQIQELGRTQGMKNVQNGHLRRIGSLGGKIGGKVAGKKNIESGHIQALGRAQGYKNIESGHLARARLTALHTRWHTNRGIQSPLCCFCRGCDE